MDHRSIAYLEGEADALELEAARIEQALAGGRAPDDEARACIERAESRLGAMAELESRTIGAVLREHVAEPGKTPLGAQWRAMQEAAGDRRRIRQDLAQGTDCRKDLQAYARHLRWAAAVERDQVAPWARRELGDVLLREADARMARDRQDAPEVGVDWDRLAS